MAFTLNRRLAQLIDSNGQLNTGKIPNDYITSDHVADNTITSAMLHTSFTVSTSNLTSIDTDDVSEGSSNLYYTNARVDTEIDSYLSGGTGVTYSSGAISIGQDVGTSATPPFGNITTTGYIAGPATFTIDPAAVGDNTGTVVIAGNLQVDGTTTTINSTTMSVDDLNITLASGAANAAAANGAGITVDGASATITYDGTNDEWDFNKDINVTGTVTTDGLTVDGTSNFNGTINAKNVIYLKEPTSGTANGALFIADTQEVGIQAFGTSGHITFDTGSGVVERMRIASNGDISFYEDTGTTAKLFWDASAESLGIGTDDIGTHSLLDVFGGAVQIINNAASFEGSTADASLHIKGAEPSQDRLTQLSAVGTSKKALNLIASTDSNDADQWWSWGVDTDDQFKILHGTSFSDALSGIRIQNTGNLVMGNTLYFNNATDSSSIANSSGSLYLNSDNSMYLRTYDGSWQTRLTILDGGNVGIGTNNPGYNLHVEKLSASANVDLLVKNTGTDGTSNTRIMSYVSGASGGDPKIGLGITGVRDYFFRIDNSDSDKLKLDTNGTDIVTIDNSGKVGIGYDTPASLLDVRGSLAANGTAATPTAYFVNNQSGATSSSIYIGASTGIDWKIGKNVTGISNNANFSIADSSGNRRFDIDTSGNVGIGTDSPLTSLHIKKSGLNGAYGRSPIDSNLILENTNTSVTESGYLILSGYMGNSTSQYQAAAIGGGKQEAAGNGFYGGYLNFWTTSGGGNGEANSGQYERMRIDQTGKVGIGTTGPLKPFHLQRTAPSSVGTPDADTMILLDHDGDQYIEFRTTGTDTGTMQGNLFTDNGVVGFIGYKQFTAVGVNGNYGESIHIGLRDFSGSDQYSGIYLGNTASDVAEGVNSPHMFIKSGSGNIGIGTVSNYSTAKLQVKTATNVNLGFQTGTTETTGFKINAYNDAGNANIPLELNGSVVVLKTGEARRMTIDASGNVNVNGGNIVIDGDQEIQFLTQSPSTANGKIYASDYPSQGYTSSGSGSTVSNRYWPTISSAGGVFLILNTDGGAGSSENTFDSFVVWQGNRDGDKLFKVSNAGNTSTRRLAINSAGSETTFIPNGSGLDRVDLMVRSYASGEKNGQVIACDNDGEAHLYMVDTANTSGTSSTGANSGGWGLNIYYDGMSNYPYNLRTGLSGTWTHREKIDFNGTREFMNSNLQHNDAGKSVQWKWFTTPSYWYAATTGMTTTNFNVNGGWTYDNGNSLPSNVKAIYVTYFYHISGYGTGDAGQGDHASDLWGPVTPSNTTSWSFTTSGNVQWGSAVFMHDGDASETGNMLYYGAWYPGAMIAVNSNNNIYARLSHGYSGGTHYHHMYCWGYAT